MKIPEIKKASQVMRDMMIPAAVVGTDVTITVGQLLDAASKGVVRFSRVLPPGSIPLIGQGEPASVPPGSVSGVLYHETAGKFMFFVSASEASIPTVYVSWTGGEWPMADFYASDGSVRSDCLFLCEQTGMPMAHIGGSLVEVGISEAERRQIALSAPIRISSEEELERMAAAGECVEGQLYYVPEE